MEMKRIIVLGTNLVILLVLLSGCNNLTDDETLTLAELAQRVNNPGDVVIIKDEIAKVELVLNSSYGSFKVVTFENYTDDSGEAIHEIYSIMVDYNAVFYENQLFEKTLHFEEYSFNGNQIVYPIEGYAILDILSAVGVAIDATSLYAGYSLVLQNSSENIQYRFHGPSRNHSYSFLLDEINVTLYKATQNSSDDLHRFPSAIGLFATDYYHATQWYIYQNQVDFMTSLRNNTSENGIIEFTDENLNGILDANDTLKLLISPTPDEYTFETYFLRFQGPYEGEQGIVCLKYIVNWYNGPFDILFESEVLN